jgi:hypothetical protein
VTSIGASAFIPCSRLTTVSISSCRSFNSQQVFNSSIACILGYLNDTAASACSSTYNMNQCVSNFPSFLVFRQLKLHSKCTFIRTSLTTTITNLQVY